MGGFKGEGGLADLVDMKKRGLVSLPMHQVLRALTPLFTVALYRVGFGAAYSRQTYLSLVPLILGVVMATTGESPTSSSRLGVALTLLGAATASAKTVATNRLQTAGLRFSALELVWWMNSFAGWEALAVAGFNGEMGRAWSSGLGGLGRYDDGWRRVGWVGVVLHVLSNASLAFGLNVVSYSTNRLVGALAMSVCGNVKLVVAVAVGVKMWSLRVEWRFIIGKIGMHLRGLCGGGSRMGCFADAIWSVQESSCPS